MDTTPKKILIIQLRRIGDVVFTLPVLGELRKQFPNTKIDFLVEKPSDQFVRLNPYVDETLVYEKDKSFYWAWEIRKRKYDWVLDFLTNGRTLLLSRFSGAPMRMGFSGPFSRRLVYNRLVPVSTTQYIVDQKLDFLRSLGLKVSNWSWDIAIPKEEKSWAESFLKEAGITDPHTNMVGIAPASRRATRRWIPERFTEVIQHLKQSGSKVILFWGLGELEFVQSLSKDLNVLIPPQTNLLQLAALIERCSLVVGLDNGPRNIAVALGVPTLALFGPTNPISINPHNDPKHQVLSEEKLFCIACGLNTCPYHHECMENISSNRVIKKIKEMRSELCPK